MSQERRTCRGLFLLFILSIIGSAGLWAQAPFVRTYGGWSHDQAVKVLAAEGGGFVVLAESYSFIASSGGAWLFKVTANGLVEWQRAYALADYSHPIAFCGTTDGGYIILIGAGTVCWVVKVDSSGTPLWQKKVTYSVTDDFWASAVCPAADAGVFVVGKATPGLNSDVSVLKLSSEGDIVWQKAYDSGNSDSSSSAEPTPAGGCVIAGQAEIVGPSAEARLLVFEIDANGAVISQGLTVTPDYLSYVPYSVRTTQDGGRIVAGWQNGGGTGSAFVAKFKGDGTLAWQRNYPSYTFKDVRQSGDGGYVVVGNSNALDMLVAKLAGDDGLRIWARAYGGAFAEYGAAIALTAEGDYAAAGMTESFGAGASDVCLVRAPLDGSLRSCRFGREWPIADIRTPAVSQAAVSLAVTDTTAAIEDSQLPVTDTRAISLSFELCAAKKVLTIQSTLQGPASAVVPQPGSYVHDAGDVVDISAQSTVDVNGTQYDLSGWNGDINKSSAVTTVTAVVDDDMTVRANYNYHDEDGGGDGGSSDDWGDGGHSIDEDWGGAGDGSAGRCFIASAAYRTPLHPAVRMLREFRDRRLLTNGLGRAFVDAYYRNSPALARVIAVSPILRSGTRVLLLPVVAAAFLVLKLGWAPALVVLAVLSALTLRRVRRRLRIALS